MRAESGLAITSQESTLPPISRPRSEPGQADLVARLKKGDGTAYEELVGLFELKVYNIARGMTRNQQDAEDVLQDTFMSVFRGISSFKGQCSLSTWVYRIAFNASLMKIRGRRNDGRLISIEENQPRYDETGHRIASLPDWHPRADEILLDKELGGQLREAIACLPDEYRAVLILRDQEGLSNEEVGSVLELSVAAVKSRLHRARVAVREQVKKYVLEGR